MMLNSNFALFLTSIIDLSNDYPGCVKTRLISEEDVEIIIDINSFKEDCLVITSIGEQIKIRQNDKLVVTGNYHFSICEPLTSEHRDRFLLK